MTQKRNWARAAPDGANLAQTLEPSATRPSDTLTVKTRTTYTVNLRALKLGSNTYGVDRVPPIPKSGTVVYREGLGLHESHNWSQKAKKTP